MDDHLIPLRENILVEQELLHDAKVECFAEVQKMEDIIKALKKHLENASQVYQNMESLQTNTKELDEWKNIDNNGGCGLLIIKAYDIILHTLATDECEEIASKFQEKVKQSLVGIIKVYTNNIQDMKKNIQWPKINIQVEQPVPFSFF